MPPEFNTFNLGRVLQTAEAIKGMRRAAETDRLRDAYLGVQTQNAQQAGVIAGNQEQRVQAEAQSAARANEAKRVYHVADAVFRAESPRDAVMNLAPDFVQEFEAAQGPGSFAQLQDDQVKQLFGELRERSMVQAGIQPKYSAPIAGQQHGRDVFFQTDEHGDPRVLQGVQPRPQNSNGISLRTPDGTEVQVGGNGVPNYGGTQFSKPTRTKLEEVFTNSQANAYALREQLSRYRPGFSTLGGKAKAGIANAKEMLGMENAPQQQQYLSEFTSWKADTARLLSQYLNQLSGAAISPHEEARLKAGFPNAEDGPTEYQAKAQATMRSFALAQARAAYLLSNPAQRLDSVSLDRMSSIITEEANRLAAALQQGGMDEAQAKQRAIADTRARYGMQ